MKKIISFVKGIFNAIDSLQGFVHWIFKVIGYYLSQIIYLIRYIIQSLSVATTFIGTLPRWVSAMAYLCMSVAVLYIVLGRNGGKS